MKKLLLVAAAALLFLLGLALLMSLLAASSHPGESFSLGKKIAVIPLKGEITSDKTLTDGIYADDVVADLEDAEGDSTIAGIFLDIDSPGGSVVATKQIVYQIRESEKPVVAYIGEMGASGGYYIAASSDYIVADADSLTGSIGVVSLLPNLEGLLEKVGVKMNILKEGENKAMASPFKEMSPEQEQIMQRLLADIFQQFKQDVLSFRGDHVHVKQFAEIADGRVLSGRQALEVGLIDEVGAKKKALAKIGELTGLGEEPELVYYEKAEFSLWDFFTQAGNSFGGAFKRALLSNLSAAEGPALR